MSEESNRETSPARRRPTIGDIAAEAGVSKGLVSLILNDEPGPSAESRARVLEIADRIDYRTNRTASLLARRRTHLLGVTTVPAHPFYGQLVEEIQEAAEERNYELVLGVIPRSGDERGAIETLVGYRCEALVLLGSELPTHELSQLTDNIPTASIGRIVDLPWADVVHTSEEAAMSLLVDHLVGLGHRHILHIDGGPGYLSGQRRDAFEAAMTLQGFEPIVIAGGSTIIAGRDVAMALDLHAGDKTAIVAFNDNCAVGVVDHLRDIGVRVPEDVSVTGMDDTVLARLSTFDLTTVSQSTRELAQRATHAAIDRLEERHTEPQDIVIPPELIVRSSTGPAPGVVG